MLKFVILSILFSTCFKEAFSKETQFDVLKEFYYATNGDSWEFNNEWLSNSDVCKWHGVLCNVNQEVKSLNKVSVSLDYLAFIFCLIRSPLSN